MVDIQDITDISDFVDVKSVAKNLLKKVQCRNKLIRIAESSPGAWATVNEYEKPSLGSDSEDQKKLKIDEIKAIKKLKISNVKKKSSFDFMLNTGTTPRRPMVGYQPHQRQFGLPAYNLVPFKETAPIPFVEGDATSASLVEKRVISKKTACGSTVLPVTTWQDPNQNLEHPPQQTPINDKYYLNLFEFDQVFELHDKSD